MMTRPMFRFRVRLLADDGWHEEDVMAATSGDAGVVLGDRVRAALGVTEAGITEMTVTRLGPVLDPAEAAPW